MSTSFLAIPELGTQHCGLSFSRYVNPGKRMDGGNGNDEIKGWTPCFVMPKNCSSNLK